MKYCRKQPVEAIQWRGDNQNEVHQLASKAVEGCYTADDSDSNLHVAYWDDKKRKHLAAIPKFGWVVVEGKTLQFYKDKTFRQTFKSAEDEGSKVDDKSEPSILDLARQTDKGSNKRLMEILGKSFEDMTHSEIVVDHFGALFLSGGGLLMREMINYKVLAKCFLISAVVTAVVFGAIILSSPWNIACLYLLITGLLTGFAVFTYIWFED